MDDGWRRWMRNWCWCTMNEDLGMSIIDNGWWMMMQVALCLDGRAGGQADRQERASEQGVCSSCCYLSVPCSVHDSPAQQVRSHASSAVCPVLCDGSIDCGFITLTHGLVNHHVATRFCPTGWPCVSQTMRPGSASAGTLRAISRPRYQSLCLLPSYCAAANQLATLLVCAPPTTLGRRRVVRVEPRWKEKTVMADCGGTQVGGWGRSGWGKLGQGTRRWPDHQFSGSPSVCHLISKLTVSGSSGFFFPPPKKLVVFKWEFSREKKEDAKGTMGFLIFWKTWAQVVTLWGCGEKKNLKSPYHRLGSISTLTKCIIDFFVFHIVGFPWSFSIWY
jgi:hypothetical protein